MKKEIHRKKLKHYNHPGHAHELTFSCYRRSHYLADDIACDILLEELRRVKESHNLKIWAYVFMSNHVHLLIWPTESSYSISKIQKDIKGSMSRKYSKLLQLEYPKKYEQFLVNKEGSSQFRFWQSGGGFDQNLWNSFAIHIAIQYIENNPVRAGIVSTAEEYQWSSAGARSGFFENALLVDEFNIPVLVR